MTRKNRAWGACAVSALAALALSGCGIFDGDTDGSDVSYEQAYADHKPLHVVGYPSTGSLGATQELVWRLADGKPGELRDLATSDSDESQTKKTAENWVKGFEDGAGGEVTADFYDSGSVRQVVVLYFHDTKQIKEFSLRTEGDSDEVQWRFLMKETDFKDATRKPTWAPAEPGKTGSKTSQH